MGRKFVRLSVGGVRDEAEIRGHRRTYIGAMPGTIVRALRDAGTNNPVMMIDEIDKVGSDYRGDPQSALLEVLDPSQNFSFRDHYLDLPLDLSQVLFVCTANQLETISPPLRDRMEIITLSGYTEFEKLQIAKRYLIKKQREANGLRDSQVQISDAAVRTVINDYTREAGVRNLEREIGTVFRKVARKIAEAPRFKARIKPENVSDYLQKPRYFNEVKKRMGHDRRVDRACLDAGRRGHHVHRVDDHARNRKVHADRSARRRDEGKRDGCDLVPARPLRRARTERGLLRKARPAHSRAGRRRPEGRPLGRHRDGNVDRVAPHQP